MLFDLDTLERHAAEVHRVLPATPQISWPLLNQRLGTEIWLKHENHTQVGAFKIRGGLSYFAQLRCEHPEVRHVVSATRGNHGQSVAFSARRNGIAATIVVPRGNSVEKNAAVRALGGEVIEHGDDFQAASEYASVLASERGMHRVPSFHPALVCGVASYCLEFLRAVPDLDVVYVPIGLGSGICAMIAARDALGLQTEIVGVASAHAPAYALSFEARRPIAHPVSTRLADGLACSTPEPDALAMILAGATRIVQVDDEEVAAAMRVLFEDTHNVAEGAGAASLAAVMQERRLCAGRRVGAVLSGANVDRAVFVRVLGNERFAV
ncbi:threonine dehydratase [Cognatazoarcus halotolerans]|uniref:threonine dehydratase n=1 Tax=Cognatazoarcus halotolerans TaxID=2686016 RepID=UPI00135C2D79|nr:threonine dehydratase [Cognatazoarcus halotolerans]MCB1898890.1 threonine dehydratase [Rhodocyclaceae bacterium]MCP5309109.1 threonine dehydratase [Zoogloeaceae bacterium]